MNIHIYLSLSLLLLLLLLFVYQQHNTWDRPGEEGPDLLYLLTDNKPQASSAATCSPQRFSGSAPRSRLCTASPCVPATTWRRASAWWTWGVLGGSTTLENSEEIRLHRTRTKRRSTVGRMLLRVMSNDLHRIRRGHACVPERNSRRFRASPDAALQGRMRCSKVRLQPQDSMNRLASG